METFAQYIIPAIVTFAIGVILGPFFIKLMKRLKFGQQVRDDGPQSHLAKQNTPTIGGIIIFASVCVAAIIFGLKDMALIAALSAGAYGLVGFLDDFIKIVKKRSLGLRAYQKIIGQFGIAILLAVYAYNNPYIGTEIILPFTDAKWDLGLFYIPVAVFVVIAIVNAVNLTDGLDGLASSVSSVIILTFTVLIIAMSNAADTEYAAQLNDLAKFGAVMLGGVLAFLRFNIYPARIFMGDTGSLMIGGAISAMVMFSRMMLLIPIAGGVLVASCVSVILQVGSYKLRKKRIFKMAPLHHHFELKGNHETKVTAMYVIVTVVLCLITMLMVKI
ncbi:MAG: phospho-N-acetylmuramoyl-pentapeptide-transferase [Clostridia bacterium]|nr:phospho-N-acetylmuramoyl-pentapeptide-transferase [Clostridia bacterium]